MRTKQGSIYMAHARPKGVLHMATIEHRGDSRWRIGVQMPSSAGKYARRWVRRTITLPPGMTDAEQRRRIEVEAKRLEVDVADGHATPDTPYGSAGSAPTAPAPASPASVPPGMGMPGALPTVATPVSPSDITVQQLYDIWMTTHVIPNCKPSTAANYSYFMGEMLRDIGSLPLNACTPTYLKAYMAHLATLPKRTTRSQPDPAAPADTISARTLQHYYDTLRYMMGEGVRMQLLYYNPMDNVTRPKAPRRRPTAIDDAHAVELLRDLTETAKPMLTVSVLLALMCGLRLGEACALTWGDIDLDAGRMTISRAATYTSASGSLIQTPKTDSSVRTIDLPPALVTLLRELRASYDATARAMGSRWRGDGRIICGWDGTPVHHDTPSGWWREWARAHGYAGVRYHDLRHTHACLLLAAGIDVASVAAHMGHASPETTLRHYADAVHQRDQASAKVMQSVLTDALPPKP